jgi:competence protein ComEC
VSYRPQFPASWIESARDRIGSFIDANLAYPERAEMRALVIGDRGGIDERLRNRFARGGMAHLLVISGLHLGLVSAAVFAVVRVALGLLPGLMELGWANKIAALLAMVAVTAYAAIAGGHVSTTRALVMVLAYMLAILIDRPREALASLALAALVICVAIPGSSADIGFQLSFVSVFGIVLGMRRFGDWWREQFLSPARSSWAYRAGAVIMGYAAVSFWASLATAPLTAFYFNQVSLVGVAANAVVVPVMGFGATVLGLAASALSFVWLWPAVLIMRVAGRLLAVSNALAGWFVALPGAWMHIFTPTVLELALAYALLMLWLTGRRANRGLPARAVALPGGWRSTASRYWRVAALALVMSAIIADGAWWTYRRYFDPLLRVTFLSVGQGDAAVIRFPGSRVMLIDGGPLFRSGFDLGERVVAPYLWSLKIMRVDYIVMSHPHIDHFGGLRFIARNFSPREFWWTGASSTDIAYARLQATLGREHVSMKLLDLAATPISVGGVTVRCLSSLAGSGTKANDVSMVLRLALGRASFLFTGDMEAPEERKLLAERANLGAGVLKVPHHGSRTSSIPAFVKTVGPSIAVISLGYRNRFHFPSAAVVERYRENGALVLRTDEAGAITVLASPLGIIALKSYRQGQLALPKRLSNAGESPSGSRSGAAAPHKRSAGRRGAVLS